MEVIETIERMRQFSHRCRLRDQRVGLVPTMGALHEGHLSLIRRCREECDVCVVSVFVNPSQFGPGEDYESYPRDFQRDRALCERLGADVVFYPSPERMYPREQLVWVDVERLGDHLCGSSRPGHFRGVCTVVAKLFHLVEPAVAYFGDKDAQQLAIIQRMVEDLAFPVVIRGCAIVREADGLAMSSRNQRLGPADRQSAVVLSESLAEAKAMIEAGERDCRVIGQAIRGRIEAVPAAEIDYITIVDKELLQPQDRLPDQALIALAVRFGDVRLIDNMDICLG